jgi:hypothetical protein
MIDVHDRLDTNFWQSSEVFSSLEDFLIAKEAEIKDNF